MTKICEMTGVREYAEGFPVEIHIDDESGRVVVVGRNEGGYNEVAIDLMDLIGWLKNGSVPIPWEGISMSSNMEAILEHLRQEDNSHRFWRIKKGEHIPEWLEKGATAAGMVAGDDLIVTPSETEGYEVYLADPNSSGPMIRVTAENIPEGFLVIGAPTCFHMASSLHYTIGTLREENEALVDALRGLLKAYENALDWTAELPPETAEAERIANEVLEALTSSKPEQSGRRPIETAPAMNTPSRNAALEVRVKVKQLEWTGQQAEGVDGLAFYRYGGGVLFRGPTDNETSGWYETFEEAKAAAQADYERRILSALTAGKPKQTVPGGWRPIETAPRDGSRFWAAEPEDGWITDECRWVEGAFRWCSGDNPEHWPEAHPTYWTPFPTHDRRR